MTHAEIIARLGGATLLARALGIQNSSTVAHWARDGRSIPAEWWEEIAALPDAAPAGIDVAMLAAGHPRRKRAASAAARAA